MLLIITPPDAHVFGYDAALHAILIGFVLSMVFGHALIILPAVTRVRISYRSNMYIPLAALHASLALRVVADVVEWHAGRLWSGGGTVFALVLFALTVAGGAWRRGEVSKAAAPK